MNTNQGHDDMGTLGEALASIMGHLRGHPYGRFLGRPVEALHGEADRFANRLAKHLLFTEEIPFPAAGKGESRSACDSDRPEKDHQLFHLYARDLALEILAGNTARAYAVARSFLAVLLDHIQRCRPPVSASVCEHPVRRN